MPTHVLTTPGAVLIHKCTLNELLRHPEPLVHSPLLATAGTMAPQFLDQFNLNVSLGTSMPIAAIAGLALYGGYLQFKKTRPRLPPGPKGTLFSLPKNPDPLPWIGYAKWAETYGAWPPVITFYTSDYQHFLPGDVMYFSALGNQMLILNSYEAMIDLCEKNSELYSSRPVRTMNTEL